MGNKIREVDILFEYAHIYMDEEYGYEQEKSIEILLLEINKMKNKDFACTVLIDDLNIKEKTLNIDDVLSIFMENSPLNYIGMESKFDHVANQVLNKFDNKFIVEETFRKSNKRVVFFKNNNKKISLKNLYENGEIKYSCTMLSLCWTLCKLGIYEFPDNSILDINERAVGKKLVNILHEKYKPVEENVIYLLKKLFGKEYKNKIRYVYFK